LLHWRICPGLDYIFIQLNPAPPTPHNVGIVTLVSNAEEFPRMYGQDDQAVKKAWEEWGLIK
jgi:hypothetical protein